MAVPPEISLRFRLSALKSLCEQRPAHERAPLLEHEPHPRQGHHTREARSLAAASARLSVPSSRSNSRPPLRLDSLLRIGWGEVGRRPDEVSAGEGGEGRRELSNSTRYLGGHPSSQIQNRHLRPRLLLASASRLQELHDADAPSGMVAGEAQRQRRPRQTPSTRTAQTRLANHRRVGMRDGETEAARTNHPAALAAS